MTVETKKLPQPEFYQSREEDFNKELIRALTENLEILTEEMSKLEARIIALEP